MLIRPLRIKISSGSLAAGDAFSGELAREAGEDVGTYAIQQGTLAMSNNYNLTFVEGTFTIRSSDSEGPSAPTVAGISPQSGQPGDTLDVVINGSNFTGTTKVNFGPGVTVNSFKVESPTRIVANITIDPAAGENENKIVVTTALGEGQLPGAFSIDLSAGAPEAGSGRGLWLILILLLMAIALGSFLFAWFKRRKKRVDPELAPILAPSRPLGGTREAAEPARAPAADLEQNLGEAAQTADLEQAPTMTVDQPLEATQEAVEPEQPPMVAATVAADQTLEEAGKTVEVEQAPVMAADQPPEATEETVEPEQAPVAAENEPLEETEKTAGVPQAAAAVVSRPRRRTTKKKTTTSTSSQPRKRTTRKKKQASG